MIILEAIDKFIDYHVRQSERSGTSYRVGLNHYVKWLGDEVEAEDLTSEQAYKFAKWLANDYRTIHGTPLSRAALALYLTSLLKFYDWLIITDVIQGENLIKTSEWIKRMVRNRHKPPIEKKLPEPEWVKALLEAVDQEPDNLEGADAERRRLAWLRDRAIMYCLESSGVRVGELATLVCGDLRPNDKGAYVKGKGGKERFARFSPQAWQRLTTYLKARGNRERVTPLFSRHDRAAGKKILPLSTLTIQRMVARLAEETGVLEKFHLTPHSFRHYFATRFIRHTKSLELTQDVLGHANPSTTRIYAKTFKEDHIKAHKELFDEG